MSTFLTLYLQTLSVFFFLIFDTNVGIFSSVCVHFELYDVCVDVKSGLLNFPGSKQKGFT